MFPESEKDFFVSEPLGDLLFTCAPDVYYAVFEGIDYPDRIYIRKIPAGANFLKALSGYFSKGSYHLSFEFGGVNLCDYEFGEKWAFSKEDMLRYIKSHEYLRHADVIDETGE